MTSLNTDPTDFSKMSSADIFNNTVVSILQDLDNNAARLDAQRTGQMEQILQGSQETTDLLSAIGTTPNVAVEDEIDYNAPVVSSSGGVVTPTTTSPVAQKTEGGFKLSNYGYDSDSSPDYNSNVLRIGHANNPLKDGVSAALTKSLAQKYGLKTGDMFEAVTADGKTLVRRYDDTVPNSYKGRALPETVDLYERSGSNKFGGRVLEIRPIKK